MIDSTLTFALNTKAIIDDAKGALGLKDVYYADQNRIPRTPAVCVEPAEKTRELNGAPRRALTIMRVYILVYHNPITSSQVAAQETDSLTEALETVLHADAHMNGTVIDSMVKTIEYGYAQRNNSLFRTSRLLFEARSQAILPSSL